jgi:hypothetical protein
MPPKSHHKPRPLLAWDGEGWEHDGRHVYGYLANSDGDERYNQAGLSSVDCLDFLIEAGREKLNIIFSGSYDVTLILKDLPPEKAREAMADNELTGFVTGTYWNGYKISYVPRKYLYVRREHEKTGVMLWDVWGFFQGSFLEALEKWFGKDYPELNLIHEGKTKRSDFNPSDISFIRKYNAAELRALLALMEALLTASEDAGLHLSRFDGAGAVAAAMLKKHDIKKRVFLDDAGEKIRLPMEMRLPAEIAYYGGRIEAPQYGRAHATVYHYDINSAYPAALINLPNIGRGTWRHEDRPVFSRCPEMSLFRVKWDVGNSRLCPFPYRSALQQKILYPPAGESWVWYPEVFVALNTRRPGWDIEIIEAWVFEPEDPEDRPYAFIQEYYDRRAALVAETKTTGKPNGAEKVIKLGLNSLYGKTAQRVGAKPFYSLAYAGYITSYTRSMLFSAAMQAPDAIIALATDGIFSLSPLTLPCPQEKVLGAWEFSKHDDMILVQSGHYLLKDGEKWRLWSRGFDKFAGDGSTEKERSESYQCKILRYIADLLNAWATGDDKIYLSCSRFCTLKSALIGDRWDKRGQWIKGHSEDLPGKELKIVPLDMKRETDFSMPQGNPADGMIKTVPTLNFTPEEMSAPYRAIEEAEKTREAVNEDQIEECLIR